MGPRMREDTGREGDEGDGFLLPCSRGQALRGKNGWGGRCVRNDIWEKGMALEGEGGFETRPPRIVDDVGFESIVEGHFYSDYTHHVLGIDWV